MQNAGGGFETASTMAYNTLRDEIVAGKLSPGFRLVRRNVSKRLGISPIPVMEALFRLEQDGLVESQPMFGSRVVGITLENVKNDQVLREALECEAARRCAEHASDVDLAELARLAKQMDDLMSTADQDNESGMRAHLDFHLEIARKSGVPILEREIYRVWIRHLMRLNWLNAATNPVPANWHRNLVKAIASRDAARAESVMREHVRRGREYDQDLLKQMTTEGK